MFEQPELLLREIENSLTPGRGRYKILSTKKLSQQQIELFEDKAELFLANEVEKHSYFKIDESTNKKSFFLKTTVPDKKYKAYNIISVLGVIWVFITDGKKRRAQNRGKNYIFEIEFHEDEIIFLDDFKLENSSIVIKIYNDDKVNSIWNKSSEEYIKEASSFITDDNFSLLGKAPNTSKYTKENSSIINSNIKIAKPVTYFNKRIKVFFFISLWYISLNVFIRLLIKFCFSRFLLLIVLKSS